MARTNFEVENGIEVFDGSDFAGDRHRIRLSDYAPGQWHNLAGGTDPLTNRIESMIWHLPADVIVTFASLPNGGGRQFEIKNGGIDSNLSEAQDWDDDIESWRWQRRRNP